MPVHDFRMPTQMECQVCGDVMERRARLTKPLRWTFRCRTCSSWCALLTVDGSEHSARWRKDW